MTENFFPSPEAEIIRQIEELIRKLATGHASPQEIQLLHDLQKKRVDLMRPKVRYEEEKVFAHVK